MANFMCCDGEQVVGSANVKSGSRIERDISSHRVVIDWRGIGRFGESRIPEVVATDADIAEAGTAVAGKTELEALIAYLQMLGTAIK